MVCLSRSRSSDLNVNAESFKAADEALRDSMLVTAVEVLAAEIFVRDVMPQHVIDRCEHRRGDGQDRLLRPAAS